MTIKTEAAASQPQIAYQLSGSPAIGLAMGTWGFFIAIAHLLILGGVGIGPDLASLRKFDSGISG